MMKRFVACQLICLIVGLPQAASAEPMDLARRLVQVSQGETMTQQMFDVLTPQIMSIALGKGPRI